MGEHKHQRSSSFRDQLIEAARKAAVEATTNERARCLWAADQVIKELEVKVERKIFATTVEIEAAKMKLKIARAVVVELRRAIVSGARPPGVRGEPGPAGISAEADPPEGQAPDQPVHFCAICGDQIDGEHNCGGVGLRSE